MEQRMAVFHTVKIKLQLAPNILLKTDAMTDVLANRISTWVTQWIQQKKDNSLLMSFVAKILQLKILICVMFLTKSIQVGF